MRNGREVYLGQARRCLTLAEQEFSRARGPRDDAGIRQAAEKAWGAIVQATNAILVRYGAKPGVGTGWNGRSGAPGTTSKPPPDSNTPRNSTVGFIPLFGD